VGTTDAGQSGLVDRRVVDEHRGLARDSVLDVDPKGRVQGAVLALVVADATPVAALVGAVHERRRAVDRPDIVQGDAPTGELADVAPFGRQQWAGGVQLDEVLIEHAAKEFMKKHKTDPRQNDRSLAKLRLEAEAVKKALSLGSTAAFSIESLADGVDFGLTVNRTRYDLLAGKIFARFTRLIESAVEKADLDILDIDDIRGRRTTAESVTFTWVAGAELRSNCTTAPSPEEESTWGAGSAVPPLEAVQVSMATTTGGLATGRGGKGRSLVRSRYSGGDAASTTARLSRPREGLTEGVARVRAAPANRLERAVFSCVV